MMPTFIKAQFYKCTKNGKVPISKINMPFLIIKEHMCNSTNKQKTEFEWLKFWQ